MSSFPQHILSPNTEAVLAYLSDTNDSSYTLNMSMNPTSLPPSAFFNMSMPGRDTPELTPESSNTASESPEGLRAVMVTDSDEDGSHHLHGVAGMKGDSGAMNKRKAGHGHTVQEEHDDEDDDSGSDDPNGHEDKRAHANDKASGGGTGSGRRGGRKSVGGGEGGTKEVSKAAKRKEQNRKAQTAFRERREAKVKDLEEKIEVLETKSYGAAAENENLRGILKRLQEENVALKQAAFTFAMPVSGSNPTAPKPPTPPLSSIHDLPILPHRSSSGMIASPESLVSVNSSGSSNSANNSLDNIAMFNAFAMGGVPKSDWTGTQGVGPQFQNTQNGVNPGFITSPDTVDPFAAFTRSNSSSFSPLSPAGTSKAELDALWASFYPNGVSNILPAQTTPQPKPTPVFQPPPSLPNSYEPNPNPSWSLPADRMAFRDQPSFLPPPPSEPDWNKLGEEGINEFLASLTGDNTAETSGGIEQGYDFEQSDDFNTQLQKLLEASGAGDSPSAAFNLSPTDAYLNFGQSPTATGSGLPGLERQVSGSTSSNANSPDSISSNPSVSTAASSIHPQQVVLDAGKVVHIVGTDGKRLKPSEVWVMMGMQHATNVNDLVIDDLCDQMKSKATCADGGYNIRIEDAEMMFKQKTTCDHHKAGDI